MGFSQRKLRAPHSRFHGAHGLGGGESGGFCGQRFFHKNSRRHHFRRREKDSDGGSGDGGLVELPGSVQDLHLRLGSFDERVGDVVLGFQLGDWRTLPGRGLAVLPDGRPEDRLQDGVDSELGGRKLHRVCEHLRLFRRGSGSRTPTSTPHPTRRKSISVELLTRRILATFSFPERSYPTETSWTAWTAR